MWDLLHNFFSDFHLEAQSLPSSSLLQRAICQDESFYHEMVLWWGTCFICSTLWETVLLYVIVRGYLRYAFSYPAMQFPCTYLALCILSFARQIHVSHALRGQPLTSCILWGGSLSDSHRFSLLESLSALKMLSFEALPILWNVDFITRT